MGRKDSIAELPQVLSPVCPVPLARVHTPLDVWPPSLPGTPFCHSPSVLHARLPLSSVATVNDLACRGLDKLEEKLPFLQQPSDMVLETTRPQFLHSSRVKGGRERSCGEQMCEMVAGRLGRASRLPI